ncbi:MULTISPECIES: hypothetical protein [Paenibacillus]|uniref:hypothetical protein n=1 Tax=Paenibacillus TaxID=44249 RepID=UPI0013556BAF|nr:MULTISPECIES: hypothetical protein [Paenibacillus]MDY8025814.1 hypothetical protein [Paenibacillus polymyxa]MXO77694.1 hypothetical protein [Paenibacillus sp. OT2-17]
MEIDLTKYLPVLAAIISAVLGYFLGSRTKKNDRLIQYTQENLKDVFNPMYHELLKIFSDSNESRKREDLLDVFFTNYLSRDTIIYKLGNLELLDNFYELSSKYKLFKEKRQEEIWKDFWYDFDCTLFYKIKEGYRNSINLLYRDFNWQQYVQTKSYWKKIYYESMKFLFETTKGLNVLSLLMVYFSGCNSLFELGLFPDDFWDFSLIILGLSILAILILLPVNFQYISLTSNSKQSFSRKAMKRYSPKLLEKWDAFLIGKRKYDKVPSMYKKSDIH